MGSKANKRTYKVSLWTSSESFAHLTLDISKQSASFKEDKAYAIDLFRGRVKELHLDNACLTVERPRDLLRLNFKFKNLYLKRGGVRPNYYLYISKLSNDAECLIKVVLPPQHLAETIYKSGELDGLGREVISDSRLTRESRLVFDVSSLITRGSGGGKRFRLKLQKLLDWGSWKLVTPERVDFTNRKTADEQLENLQISESDDLAQAIEKVKRSVVEPTPWETSLELMPNLYFSLDKFGSNSSTRRYSFGEPNLLGTGGREKPFWGVKYCSSETSSLRAIYSDKITNLSGEKLGYKDPHNRDRLSFLNAKDHWNIVALTSISGIPALLRGDKNSSEPREDDPKKDSDVFFKYPPSMVARPKKNYKFLRVLDAYYEHERENPPQVEFDCLDSDTGEAIEENHGIMLPKGFDQAEITVSSVGINARLDFSAEPPAVAKTEICDAAKIDGLSLEKLKLEFLLGRKVEGFKQNKGYLLPLGVRASYITILTREPHPKSRYRQDLSLPVQRSYILIHKPEKRYPVVYQPYEGRQFPIDHLEMLTTVTAEIVPPKIDENTLKKAIGGKLIRSDFVGNSAAGERIEKTDVFWPVVKGESSQEEDVLFEFQQSSSGSKITGPLLFMSNDIVNDAELSKEIANYYNSIKNSVGGIANAAPSSWPTRRTMRLFGTRHPYAPSAKPGDTSFDSDCWLMKMQGRQRADQSEFFSRDRFLEGADHPALYPAVEKSSINVQSVSAVLGTAQKFATVKFNQKYLENSFDSSENFGELFLQFIGPSPIKFDVKEKSNASGGTASPSAEIAALSRKNGIIGANASENMSVGLASVDIDYDLTSAEDGKFDPESYFDEAKLLGLIDLGKIIEGVDTAVSIENAPQLLESYGYGLLGDYGDDLAIEIIKLAVGETAESSGIFDFVRKGIESFSDAFPDVFPLEELYPKLAQTTEILVKSLEASKEQLNTERDRDPEPKLENVVAALDKPVDAAKKLIDEIGNVIENPIPESLSRLIDAVHVALSSASDLLDDPASLITSLLANRVRFYICGDPPSPPGLELDAETKSLLFGGEPNCNDFPHGFFENIAEALFYDEYGELLETIILADEKIKELDFNAYIEKLLRSFLKQIETAVLARIASDIGDWCGTVGSLDGKIVVFIDGILNSFAAPDLQPALAPLDNNVLKFDPVTQSAISQKILELKTNISSIETAKRQYETVKSTWPTTATLCSDAQKLFSPVAAVFKAYKAASVSIVELITLFSESLVKVDPQEYESEFNSCVQGIVDSMKALLVNELEDLVNLDADNEPWSSLKVLSDAVDEVKGYKETIIGLKEHISSQVQELDNTVSKLADAASVDDKVKALKDLVEFDSDLFVESLKRSLSSPLSSLVLSGQKVEQLILEELVGPLAANLSDIHSGTLLALDAFIGYAEPFQKWGLLNPEFIKRINDETKLIAEDQKQLKLIAAMDASSLTNAYALYSRWSSGDIALVSIAELIGNTVEQVGKGNLESIINDQLVKTALKQLNSELEAIVTNFLPTSHVVKYDWKTKLPNCIPEENGIFKLIDPSSGKERECDSDTDSDRKDDLTLSSATTIDLLTGKVNSSVYGSIKPFTIHLLGDKSDFAKIRFNKLTFRSRNGGSPKFDISVREVELGDQAEFFKPLQDWLSPDSGFYIDVGSARIEAGYLLDLGIITFGTVSFLNVSLGVKAVLPFSDSDQNDKGGALFGFNCGTVQKPVGVSIAPYGGLGHIEVLANSRGVESIRVSLAFGAVIAFGFGPLTGQGRVVAGMWVLQDENGLTIAGFFEAAGSASISCFSLTIRIRMELKHSAKTGDLTGSVIVSLKFKVGFVSISFRFQAEKRIAGGSQEQSVGAVRALSLPGAVNDRAAVYHIQIPDKRTNWQGYKNKFDFNF